MQELRQCYTSCLVIILFYVFGALPLLVTHYSNIWPKQFRVRNVRFIDKSNRNNRVSHVHYVILSEFYVFLRSNNQLNQSLRKLSRRKKTPQKLKNHYYKFSCIKWQVKSHRKKFLYLLVFEYCLSIVKTVAPSIGVQISCNFQLSINIKKNPFESGGCE